MASVHFLKNKTREIEIKTEKISKNIIFMQENIEVQKIEYGFLASPERISNLAKKYLSNDYIFLTSEYIKLDEKK